MLTKNDLEQIANIIDQKLESKLENKLEEKLESKLEEKLEQKLKPIKNKLNRIAKDVHYVIGNFDSRISKNEKDIKEIKRQINFN